MNKERILKFIIGKTASIVKAMGKIDENAKGILFVVDDKQVLQGCITDGDIRRWLIKTGNINSKVEDAMMSNPKYLFVEERAQSEKLMKEASITALPLLNGEMQLIDIVILTEILNAGKEKKKATLTNVPVVIMAGGKGTRLYPYTKILPKPLIPIGDTPIVERIINRFTEYGINKYYMTVNYKKEMIKSYFADVEKNYDIIYVEEMKPLGTGGSIKLIEDKLERAIFVTNCDALILADYEDVYEYHKKSGNAITVVSALKNIVVPYGVLHSKENGELIGLEEKPKLSYFVNTGMYVINPNMIEMIPDDEMFHMTQLVEKAMYNGEKVGMYPISEDSFLDMGEFDEMHRMEEKLNVGE